MDSPRTMGEALPVFYVGQHEEKRALPVSDELIQHGQDLGVRIRKHAKTLRLLSSYNQAIADPSTPLDTQPLPLIPALESIDTPLGPSDGIAQLITYASSWIDLSSPDPLIANLSRQVFNLEIAYAAFCGVLTVVIPGPNPANGVEGVSQYARAVKEALATGAYLQLHIQVPMAAPKHARVEEDTNHLSRFARPEYIRSGTRSRREDPSSSWDAWNIIRSVCNYHNRLSISLDLPRRLPSLALQGRWFAEPVRLLHLSSSSFLTNSHGYPALSKQHQIFIFRCMRLQRAPWLILSGIGPLPGVDDPDLIMSYSAGGLSPKAAADAPTPNSSLSTSPTPAEAAQLSNAVKKKSGSDDPTPHLSYLRYMQRNQPRQNMLERFGGGFQDYLQSPLQPLTDNLESITYEVFEKDPIKYAWYERAIERALRDWQTENKSKSSESDCVVIAVVGSGRGPLVTRALNASENSGVPVRVYAIEKNPNAYVLLQRHNMFDWANQVTIVKTDMRAWKGPTLSDGSFGKVDILVSELLGSFADNELSPECLDGVQHVLNPDHGISIPASYTAHLTPISTPRIWADLQVRSTTADPSAFEIPWVVMLQQMDYLSTLPGSPTAYEAQLGKGVKMQDLRLDSPLIPNVQTAWRFAHPLPLVTLAQASLRKGGSALAGGGGFTGGDGANEHNVRFSKTKFEIQEQGVCHGLGGYFETILYNGNDGAVELSTNPVTMEEKSKDMISWFPIFFPLKTPIQVPANSTLAISMWRQTDDRKVWYEWLVESFIAIDGDRIRIAISDLHSSKANGCQM